jgi:hypothetical protein
VPSTSNYHRSVGKAPKLSFLHGWSLPFSGNRGRKSTRVGLVPAECARV